MIDITYIVNPLSAADIELDVYRFLFKYQRDTLFGRKPLNSEKLLDNIFIDKGYSLQIVSDDKFAKGILAATEIESRTIEIRESDFNSCQTNGLARMNISHEVGHVRLQSEFFEENKGKLYKTCGNYIPAYLSSEWQANVWGSCCLMPFPAVVKVIENGCKQGLSEDQIINIIKKKFIVSKLAARARYLTIKNYVNKGIYNDIVERMEKENRK